tara:strand:- start:399 stop:824 length:426 start_codon:yes stop_codon:yes gene_type:complete
MDKNIYFLSYFIVDIIIIFVYGSYRCDNPEYEDVFQTHTGIWDLDGWSLSHFVFFVIISAQFPEKNYLIIAGIFGILWELFEYYYGKHRPGWLGGDCRKLATDKGKDSNWWYAKISDIVMNILGLYCGYHLYKKYPQLKYS